MEFHPTASGTYASNQEIILGTHSFRKSSSYLFCTVVNCIFWTNYLWVWGKMGDWYA